MRLFWDHRDRAARASRRLQETKEWADGKSATKIMYWEVIDGS